MSIPTWLIWSAVVCAAFTAGFFLGAIMSADARMAQIQRESEDEYPTEI